MVVLWVGLQKDLNRLNKMKYSLILIISVFLFTSCKADDKLSDNEIQQYIVKGKEIGKATVNHLGKNLMKNMKAGGTAQAIPFCNASAQPLTDEITSKYNVTLKRTSLKIRNSKNAPNTTEKELLNQYLKSISKGEKLKPVVKKDSNGKVHFYAPIKLEGKCLACHGTVGKEVSQKTDSILKALYPNDKATGFKIGDLRGMVNITFNK